MILRFLTAGFLLITEREVSIFCSKLAPLVEKPICLLQERANSLDLVETS